MRIQLLPHKSYTYYEIAQFFNITPQSFKVHKFEKLEELKNYAIFHEINNSIVIDKVFCSYYLGSLSNRRAFKRMMFACMNNNIVNEYLLAKEMRKRYSVDLQDYSLKELIYYIRYYFTEYYGNDIEGLKGKKEYGYFKLERGMLLPLAAEKQEKDKIIKQWYGNLTEKVLLIQDKINNREIEKEDAWDLLSDMCGLESYESFKYSLDRAVAAQLYNGYQIFNREDYNIDISEELDEDENDEYSREEIIIS